ncbi:hypothetical protein SEVIR_2G084901v4 [Setaria viridis]
MLFGWMSSGHVKAEDAAVARGTQPVEAVPCVDARGGLASPVVARRILLHDERLRLPVAGLGREHHHVNAGGIEKHGHERDDPGLRTDVVVEAVGRVVVRRDGRQRQGDPAVGGGEADVVGAGRATRHHQGASEATMAALSIGIVRFMKMVTASSPWGSGAASSAMGLAGSVLTTPRSMYPGRCLSLGWTTSMPGRSSVSTRQRWSGHLTYFQHIPMPHYSCILSIL